jgi:sortase A
MRLLFQIIGAALVVAGLTGLGLVMLGPPGLTDSLPRAAETVVSPTAEVTQPAATPAPIATVVAPTPAPIATMGATPTPMSVVAAPPATAGLTVVVAPQTAPVETVAPTPLPSEPTPIAVAHDDSARPITWLAIPRINLQTQVVPAHLVEDGDSVTWDIPKFVAGHAESTAGAGQVGNAVVLGHLISRTLGNVFENLDRTRPGDVLHVRSGAQEFNYTVVDVRNVDRLDVDVLDPTSTPTITLITCAGVWNPLLHDYMERLIVRGELMSPGQL